MILTLQCYMCGTDYEYVGTSPHPGQCQVCGSPCVPPAGSLHVLNSSYWESANGLSKVWVYALDERDRPFEFEVAAQGNRGKLVALRVDGIAVDPQIDEALETLPPAVKTELVDAGIERGRKYTQTIKVMTDLHLSDWRPGLRNNMTENLAGKNGSQRG